MWLEENRCRSSVKGSGDSRACRTQHGWGLFFTPNIVLIAPEGRFIPVNMDRCQDLMGGLFEHVTPVHHVFAVQYNKYQILHCRNYNTLDNQLQYRFSHLNRTFSSPQVSQITKIKENWQHPTSPQPDVAVGKSKAKNSRVKHYK